MQANEPSEAMPAPSAQLSARAVLDKIAASQAEGSGTVVTGRPSRLALVDGTGNVAEAGGGQRGIRAPSWSAHPPLWLTVVG